MELRAALRYGTLEALDRELLLASAIKKDRSFLLAHPEYELTPTQERRFKQWTSQREAHEPLAYILGEKEFYGLLFSVNRFTLIPRPETELLVETALQILYGKKNNKKIAVIDVGTGSGCILISIVKNFLTKKNSTLPISFFATDISLRALNLAKKNATRHGVRKEISFVQSHLFKAIEKKLSSFDEVILLANLPYLSQKIYTEAAPTVRDFEPQTALLSGVDGLDHYRELLQEISDLQLSRKVDFLLEISPEQATFFESKPSPYSIKIRKILPDLTGRSRLVWGSL